jgi:transposase-like protein
MTSNERRKFTAEFRSQVVLEVLSGKLSVAQAAKKYKIKDNAIYNWKAQTSPYIRCGHLTQAKRMAKIRASPTTRSTHA